ncbi:MAG TPA: LysR family transcriptional regulator [Bacteroidetes bacterium]|nr:LysR family transcriptional regulator [Bacteroidota bacterium]
MTLQQLEYIVALDEERHFVRAAARCFVTQPTLSMQVRKLEDDLGVLIFDRKATPFRPTAIGEKIVQRARKLLRDAHQIQVLASEEAGEMKGEFRLGVIPTLAPSLVPRFFGPFLDRFPEVRLHIDELQTDRMLGLLESGDLDVGIMVGPVGHISLQEMPVFQEPFLLYAHPDHPLSGQDRIHAAQLNLAEMWILNQGHCFRNQVLNVCEAKGNVQPRRYTYETGSIETLKHMVQQSGGYTLVPELSLKTSSLPTEIITRRFVQPEPVREVVLVSHYSYARTTFLQNLHQEILQSIPESMRIAEGEKISILRN